MCVGLDTPSKALSRGEYASVLFAADRSLYSNRRLKLAALYQTSTPAPGEVQLRALLPGTRGVAVGLGDPRSHSLGLQ